MAELGGWSAGARVANDRASYEYLVESIRAAPRVVPRRASRGTRQISTCERTHTPPNAGEHPDQIQLLSRVAMAGFRSCSVRDMTCGVVAVHSGYK